MEKRTIKYVMYAECPECKTIIRDVGHRGTLTCDNCGSTFPSRSLPRGLQDSLSERESYDRDHQYIQTKTTPRPPIGRPVPQTRYDTGYPAQIPQAPYYDPQSLSIKDLYKISSSLMAFVGLLCFFALYFFSLLALGPAVVIVLPKMMQASPAIFVPTFIPPYIVVLGYIPGGYVAVIYFLFIVAAIFLSVFWLFYTEARDAWNLLKKGNLRFLSPPFKSNNSFFLIPQLFLALLFFNIAVIVLFLMFGITPTTPESLSEDAPIWRMLYGLANASVWEELVTRVLFIGLPLAVIELARRKTHKSGPGQLTDFIFGGKIALGNVEWFFIFLSAVVFGLAHIGGWDYWKFAPTFLSGIAFGYLFCVKGLHAAILLHFAFDYLSMPLTVFNPHIALQGAYVLVMLFLILLGMIIFLAYLYKFSSFIAEKMQTVG